MKESQAGYAIVGVLVLALVAMLLVSAGYRRINEAQRIARAAVSTAAASDEERALARAIALLQTGAPAVSPFVCRLSVQGPTSGYHAAARFALLSDGDCAGSGGTCWEVSTSPWTGIVDPASRCPEPLGATCSAVTP